MRHLRWVSAALTIPAFALLAAVGCGGGDGKGTDKPKIESSAPSTSKAKTGSSAKKEEVASTGWGTLKGKVTFDGTPPTPKPLDITKDQATCNMGPPDEKNDPTWRVGADKGVANVVVWLQEPANKYFKIPDDQKKRTDTVVLDQPFCAFEPHVFALYPSYFDGKKQERTGQKFEVKNSAPITHNTNLAFSDETLNTGGNNLVPPKSELKFDNFVPCKETDCGKLPQTMKVSCQVHPWMSATGKLFDHPFFAVTTGDRKGDKTFGEYEIKQAPAGAELELVYWHESMGADAKPVVLKKVTLKEGANTEDFKIK
jgi:hypothetical protein